MKRKFVFLIFAGMLFFMLACGAKETTQKEEKLVTQIKKGDFSVMEESDIVSIEEIASTYKNREQDIEWLYIDVNDDGVKELILQEKNEYLTSRQVIGIFDIRQNGKCVFWDSMDGAEYYFITDNGNVVYYSQYFGTYCYISYKLFKCDRGWNQTVELEICAYYLYDIDEIGYWVGIDEHDHNDMTENGVYFKVVRDDTETTVSKNEFIKEFEEMMQRDYSTLKYKSDLFWLFESEMGNLSEEGVTEDDSEERYKYPELFDYTLVNMEGDFHEKINNNPIDNDFTWEDTGTLGRIERARAYCDAWIAEIDNSLQVLEEHLTEEDYKMICASYEGWKQYLENSFNVEQSIFYPFSPYLGEYPLAGGSLTKPFVMEITARRARNYAIEIKSLEYIFTEEVEFVYEKESENQFAYKNINLMQKMQDGMKDKDILEYYGTEIEEVKTMTNGSIFIKTYSIDLNGDNLKDKLVCIMSPIHSGAHGDTFEILLNNGEFYTVISDRWSMRMFKQDANHIPMGEIYILKSKTQNFYDIKIVTDEKEIVLTYKNGKYD